MSAFSLNGHCALFYKHPIAVGFDNFVSRDFLEEQSSLLCFVSSSHCFSVVISSEKKECGTILIAHIHAFLEWVNTGNMVNARTSHTSTLLSNGKVLVAGGFCTDEMNSAELYEPSTGNWTVTGSLNFPRASHTASVLKNGQVLVVGGDGDGTAELYDPETGNWTVTGKMKHARSFHTACVLKDGKVLVAGGGSEKAAELYDLSTGNWTITGSLTDAREFHTAFVVPDGKVLVAGGAYSKLLSSAELYDPATGTWHKTESLRDARAMHTGSVLSDGKVLVAGGVREYLFDYVMSAEIYDPSTGKWTGTDSLQYPRVSSTSSLLSDGKVLLVGASMDDPLNLATATAEFYDPSTGFWTATPDLNYAREAQAASVLSDGKVLISGGYNDFCQPNCELYDPSAEHKATFG